MKRYWHREQYKKTAKKLARKSHLRKLRFKDNLRIGRKVEQGISQRELKVQNGFSRTIFTPREMCFIRNPEEMAEFIQELKLCMNDRTSVFVNMKDVEVLELNAITVMLAVMIQFKSQGIAFNGRMPKKESIRQLFVQSDFLKNLKIKQFKKTEYNFGTTICTHGNLSADPDFSQGLINKASNAIWGELRIYKGAQRVFLELMQNTNNHASKSRKGEKHWWSSVHEHKAENRAVFSFVDFGVGVFESLSNKDEKHVFRVAYEALVRRFGDGDNPTVLSKILAGDLHKTATGKYYRGKGLPGIYSALKMNQISKLVIITNDVYFNSERSECRKLRPGFSGTFVSWELSRKNESFPYDDY